MAPKSRRSSRQPSQAQLLAADGKDEIGVPGGQGIAVVRLGLGAVEEALAEQLARADGQNRAGLLVAPAQGVQVVVKDHPETHDAVVGPPAGLRQDKQPQDDGGQHDAAPHQNKPAYLDAGGPGIKTKMHM